MDLLGELLVGGTSKVSGTRKGGKGWGYKVFVELLGELLEGGS